MPAISTTRLSKVIRHFPELFSSIVPEIGQEIEILAVADVRSRLNRGVSPDGQPFEPLRFPRPQGGTKPLQNTGLLAASVSASFTEEELTIRANAPGARIHQFGGTIRPVNAKMLAIPITKEAVRAGSPRNFPADRLFVLKGQRGPALAESITSPGGKKTRLIVHYLLRPSVTIPARPYLGISAKTLDQMNLVIMAAMETKIAEQLKR